ncbi:bacterial transcriptional activator domain-containing protein [Arthrobacter glacialis]|uniref:LysM domain-containing protein n=1 Tax=Arthrobacter glacialis TaxID=1664 RepID=A0A2S3ZTH9_ARTGL|nr:bacterial transcriptional activator domain-containing protein [Arthrobacter glacialis]POH72520.1 hypothetical protein CVS27_15480 [Arthrobacter glacialis]
MRMVKSLSAALLLIILVAGIPAALIMLAGNPLPPLEVLQGMMSQPDYGGKLLFGTFFPLVAWVAWATFAFSIIIEIPAALRGIKAPQIRGLGPQQAFAAALIGAILFTATAGSLAGAPSAQATESIAPTQTVSAPQTISEATATPSTTQAVQKADTPASKLPTYTVQTGDSLWKIAEQHLGDGTRYKEIAQLNYDKIQPDGSTLTQEHWIDPGWTLTLPADAATTELPATATRTVAPGETLTGIAQEALGDATQADAIFDASTSTVQEDGQHLTDPNLIQPGWKLTIPTETTAAAMTEAPAVTLPTTPETPKPVVETPAPAPEAPAPAKETQPDALAGMGIAPTPAVTKDAPVNTQTNQAPAPAATTQEAASAEVLDTRTIGGLGAIACAGILSVLGLLRLRQRRRRQPGKRLNMPSGDSATVELQMRAVEDPLLVADLDAGLKFLAEWAQDTNTALPQMFSARVAQDEIAIYLAAPAELPAPFIRAERDGTVWTLDASAIPELNRIPSAPYPALVTLGQDANSAHIMVDLEFIGSLNIDGTAEHQAQALNAMAIEMASSPWGEDLQITLVGIAEGLPAALRTGRVRHLDDMDTLLTRLRGKVKATEAAFAALGVSSVEEARAMGTDAQGWIPEIVILGTTPDEPARTELADLVSRIPRLGIAAVTAGQLAGDWTLSLHDHSTATLAPIGLQLTPQMISDPEYAQILTLLATTEGLDAPGPDWARNIDPDEISLEDLTTQDEAEAAAETPVRHLEAVPETVVFDAESTEIPSAVADEPTISVDASEAAATVRETADPEVALTQAGAAAPVQADEEPLQGATAAVVREVLGEETQEDLDPIICILGPVVVRNIRGEVPTTAKQAVSTATVARCTALAAFLALNPGASSESFHRAFWPNQDPAGKTASSNRNKLSNQTRNWLGQDKEGDPYMPHAALEGYRLDDSVLTDWGVWLDLIGEDLAQTPTPRLVAALRLVRGQPFTGVKESNYAWAEVMRQEIIAAICDAAHELANRSIRTKQAANGRLAAAKGIMVDPTNEAMWRDAMLAEHVAGDRSGIEKMVTKLQTFLNDFEDGYEPEVKTQELIDSLLGRAVA